MAHRSPAGIDQPTDRGCPDLGVCNLDTTVTLLSTLVDAETSGQTGYRDRNGLLLYRRECAEGPTSTGIRLTIVSVSSFYKIQPDEGH